MPRTGAPAAAHYNPDRYLMKLQDGSLASAVLLPLASPAAYRLVGPGTRTVMMSTPGRRNTILAQPDRPAHARPKSLPLPDAPDRSA
jgi:hypothetical protein